MNVIVTNVAAQSLQSTIDQMVSKPFYKYSNIGISVRNVASGEVLAEVEKDKMMLPASTLKVVTTLSSIEILGEDFTYRTRVSYDGYIDTDGTLKGNIYIEGSGDPALGTNRSANQLRAPELFAKIVDDIYKFGIHCVEGNIIADESVFNSFPISPSWQWNDLGNYYAAGAWGLNINENLYSIYFHRNGKIGDVTKIAYYEPFIPNLKLENEVTIDSANTDDNAYIFGGPYYYGKRVVGTIPQGKELYKIKGSLPDPPLFFAYNILKELEKREMGGHIHKTQYHPDKKKPNRIEIKSYYSPPLKELVKLANEHSINIYCESFLKTIGLKERGIGSGSAGIFALEKYLSNKGVNTTPMHMEDGSGLSARNLVSADFLTQFLQKYASGKDPSFISNYLAAAGQNGTVKNLLNQSKAKGKMWLKSGSMDKTLTYSGFCKGASGQLVAFTVMLNASVAEKKQENKIELEKILDAIYRFS